MLKKKPKNPKVDYYMLACVLALLAFGLTALSSASTVQSIANFGTTSYYIVHQLLYGGLIGLVAMYIFSKIDYHFWKKCLPWLILGSLFLLAVVKVGGIGKSFGGAHRWIEIGPILFQPAELAKLVIIFYIAAWVEKKQEHLHDFYFGLLPSLCIVGLFAALILWQPDIGTMLVLLSVAGVMLFAAGLPWKYIFWSLIGGSLTLYGFVRLEPYRVKRLTTFFDRSFDAQGISYQVNQALLAIGSGNWFGYGYGLSRQKHNYLPEVMTDSIFAVLAEELGFLRVLIVIGLFIFFTIRGITIAKAAPDLFGKMVALGITSWISIQALINVGAMVNILPLTGIPLPFFSYGSTALIMNLSAVGILLNISRQSHT